MTLAELARVLRAGERRTRGVQDASTCHLGAVLRVMAQECEVILAEEHGEGGAP